MSKLLQNCLKATPLLLATVLLTNGFVNVKTAFANEVDGSVDSVLEGINNYESDTSNDQVTSVSQLRDVSPTDWAYEALRSLVERYGCIVGYPDRTYRGNRALSRYEFAAGLNACMQQMERLIAQSEAVLKEDIETLKRLMAEFESELAALGARVDNLEGRVSFLEDHQFSTTTKLRGEGLISIQGFDGGDFDSIDVDTNGDGINDTTIDPDNNSDNQITLSNRVRLTLETSFSGKDKLITRLQATNTPNLSNYISVGGNQARLNFDGGVTDNSVNVDRLYYTTPIGDAGRIWVGTALAPDDIYQTFSPYTESSGSGSLSRALRFNPVIYRTTQGGGAAARFGFGEKFNFTASYLAGNSSDPTEGNGLFNGEYAIGGQLAFAPNDYMGLGLAYMYSYGGPIAGGLAGVGALELFDSVEGNRATSNNIGLQGNIGFGPGINLSGWVGYTSADFDSETTDDQGTTFRADASADFWTFAANLSFADLGKEGAVLTIGGGMLPYADTVDSSVSASTDSGTVTISDSEDLNLDSSWIAELNYKFPINDNITITPGVYAVFNPGGEDADTIYVGVLRTVFKF